MPRILIVEDSPTQAERLRLILESEGLEAEVATDAEAALAALARAPFDMVISDIVMPGLSGYELCRRIRAEPEWRAIPVILLTTRKDPMDIFQGLECGADNFYTKPYDPERLIERIRNVLYNKDLRSQGKLKVGVEIAFFGRIISINSEKEQILDLLISAFEDTVQSNRELERSQAELSAAKTKIEEYTRILEERIQSSEEKYRAIVDGITEGIIAIDESGAIESINPAALRMFGYAADAVVGRNIATLMSDPHGAHPAAIADVAGAGSGPAMREVDGRRSDGTLFPMSWIVTETRVSERRSFVGACRDLTSEKAAEQQLRHAQKMESLGQLTGGIAHDFNNLLTVILGNAELLVERLADDDALRPLAEMTKTAAERSSELTNRLLAFARRQPLDPRPADVNKLISGMDGLLRRTLGEHIEIEMVRHAGLWEALVDRGQLENAILNLCINARDAMKGGGKLTVETANARLDQEYADRHVEVTPGQYVMIAVSDTGTGMPPEVIARAFDPFFTTKPVGEGSGLGLSMVYGFIKQSNGHVKVYSELGQGTTVKLYLSRVAGGAAQAEPRLAAIPCGGSEKILLVEDDDLVRSHVAAQLKDLGYRVVATHNAREAIEALKQISDFDLLLTDIVMPGGMNGRQLADEVRRLRPELPVLFTSGYSENAIVHQGRLDPGVHLLNKPYRREDLAAKVRLVLSQQRDAET